MPDRDNERWQQCWRDRETAFHQTTVNPLLIRFWSRLGLAASDRVFVPMCGKSLDLLWLYRQGHGVLGVELSPIAARAFFKESRLQPTRRKLGAFTRWEHGRLGIHCGDFFKLTAADLGDVKAVFDRASLTALPEEMRAEYVAHLRAIVPAGCKIMLLTTEDSEPNEPEHEALAIAPEIVGLYGAAFDVVLEHVESFREASPDPEVGGMCRVSHKVYILASKPG